MIRPTTDGVEIDFQVIPRARRSTFSGYRDGRVLVRLAAPPVDGAANDALRAFLSDQFSCPRRAVRIVSGERSRVKRVAVDGVAAADAERVITASCRAAAESASPSSTAPRRSRR